MREDFPTPDGPATVVVLPRRASFTASTPLPSFTLVVSTVQPAFSQVVTKRSTSSGAARSVLLNTMMDGTSWYSIITRKRSKRFSSGVGCVAAKITRAWSTFATAGRIRELLRGQISSTFPFLFSSSITESSAQSPTSGFIPRLRKTPLALHSKSPDPGTST